MVDGRETRSIVEIHRVNHKTLLFTFKCFLSFICHLKANETNAQLDKQKVLITLVYPKLVCNFHPQEKQGVKGRVIRLTCIVPGLVHRFLFRHLFSVNKSTLNIKCQG